MPTPTITVKTIGRERRPVAIIDGFAANPDAIRAAALAATFGPAAHHYPGLRAPLPDEYLAAQQPILAEVTATVFGLSGETELIDASFSVVTTPPTELSVRQRLPHCDAFAANRIALVHFLSPDGDSGTAFYRHRSTGFETIDEERESIFFGQLEAELRHGGVPAARYLEGDTALFERTLRVPARYNRALVYRSYLLHSGAIPADAALSADPAQGRLTVTGFFAGVG